MAYNTANFPMYQNLLRTPARSGTIQRNISAIAAPPSSLGLVNGVPLPAATAVGGPTAATGAGPPAGFGDILSTLLSGLGGQGGGITPEEGIAQAKRAIIQYGQVPTGMSGLTNLAPAFGSGTAKLAATNTETGVSVLARLQQALHDQQRYNVNQLQGHGILESGETGFRAGRTQTDYVRSQSDATGKLLDYLTGINSGIAQYLAWQQQMAALRAALAGFGGGGGGGGASSGPAASAAAAAPTGGGGSSIGGSWRYGTGYSPYLQRAVGGRNVAL